MVNENENWQHVGETNNIKGKLEEIETKPNWVKEIYSHDGVSRFSIVQFGDHIRE